MDQPQIAATSPAEVVLQAGKKYAFCVCGKSENQPFCDGKHKGSGFAPIVFVAGQDKTAYLCRCKQSVDQPYCDGSHNKLADDEPV